MNEIMEKITFDYKKIAKFVLNFSILIIAIASVISAMGIGDRGHQEEGYCPVCPDGQKPVYVEDCRKGNATLFNGCGPESWPSVLKAFLSYFDSVTECCNGHDICYSTCTRTKSDCEIEFRSCLPRWARIAWMPFVFGCPYYKEAQAMYCECVDAKRSNKPLRNRRCPSSPEMSRDDINELIRSRFDKIL